MNQQKIHFLEQALVSSETPNARLKAILNLMDALSKQDYPRCKTLSGQAIELAQKLKDRSSMAKANEGAGQAMWKMAEFSQAMKHYEVALDGFLGVGDLYGVARCYCGLGIICGVLEQYEVSLEYFEEGLSASQRADKPKLSATLVGNIGHVYFKLDQLDKAFAQFEQGLDYYIEFDDKHGAANMLGGMAGVHVYEGEFEKGIDLVEQSLKLHREAGHHRGVAVALMNLGLAHQKKGSLQKALNYLLEAMKYASKRHLKTVEFDLHKNLSQLYAEMENDKKSSEHLETYLALEKERHADEVRKRSELRKNGRFSVRG